MVSKWIFPGGANHASLRKMLRARHLFLTLSLLLGSGADGAEQTRPIITEAKELHRLTRAEMLAPQKVRIRGIITYKRGEEFNDFAMQDSTGGFIADVQQPGPSTRALVSGQEVEIEGFTIVDPPPAPRVSVTRLTPGPVVGLPEPLSLTPQAVLGGAGLFSYVEFIGVIRSTRIEPELDPPRLVLEFGPPNQRLSARLARFDDKTRALLVPDTRVRLRGIALAWTSANLQPYSIFLGVHDPSQIEVLSPATAPPLAERVPIGTLIASPPEGFDARRQTTRGTVTLHWPGELVVLQHKDGAIRATPAGISTLAIGDEVDATGFATAESGRIFLDEAVFGAASPGNLPEAETVDATRLQLQASSVDREGHLVRTFGILREVASREGQAILQMESGGTFFAAILPPGVKVPEEIRPGSSLELTGICNFILGERARRFAIRLDGFEIQLPGVTGVRMLSTPPWWTPQRLAAVIVVILMILGLSLLWVIALRRRVAIRSALLVREIRARHDTQLLVSERARLAADLHDTLSQTLSGAAMQMEIAEALDPSTTNDNHLSLARRLLDRSREDLRRAVWDLTPSALEERDLEAALRSLVDEVADESGCEVSIETESPIPPLLERTRSHLFRVAQEAIHNAIKHGSAGKIEIHLTYTAPELTLMITDNGKGFDVSQAPGPTQGHFGLSSMRNRVRRLGGEFTINTSPKGTRVIATVPLAPLSNLESDHS